jgi:hypothetical protein
MDTLHWTFLRNTLQNLSEQFTISFLHETSLTNCSQASVNGRQRLSTRCSEVLGGLEIPKFYIRSSQFVWRNNFEADWCSIHLPLLPKSTLGLIKFLCYFKILYNWNYIHVTPKNYVNMKRIMINNYYISTSRYTMLQFCLLFWTWSLTLKEENTLTMCENKMLRKILSRFYGVIIDYRLYF